MGESERIRWRGIEGLRVGRFPGRVNTTVILFRVDGTVVDTGPPNQWRAIRAFLAERPVAQVVVTHHHEDHAGNLGRFAGAGGPRLRAPAESLELLARGFPLQAYRWVVWGRPRRLAAEPIGGAVPVAGGELEPVLLPGHSPDMTGLLDRRRGVLFGADLYVARRQRYLRLDEDLGGILRSLRRALDLDFDTLLCSHRGVVENAKRRLRERLEWFESLCAEAARLRSGGLSTGRIARRLLGREDLVSWLSGFHYSKRNLIRECLRVADGGLSPDSAPARSP